MEKILGYFDGEIAAEMRLTEAIDRKLLSPFQYFCVSDAVDLSTLKWSRGGYSVNELENLYTTNDLRSNQIINSINKYLTDIDSVKGLGFCASIEHAKYMANYFNENGIASEALYSGINSKIRSEVKNKLILGEINFIFVVDLYNEGIDIPEINTVLFLRPTESLTVFIQQLGRGLRLSEGKECLTVLDYVGQAHKNYNFEDKFRALTGKTKHSIRHYVENGFFNLPKGCFVQLEKRSKEYILRNIKDSANNKANLINKMKHFLADTGKPLSLNNFLEYYNLDLYDFYGRNGDRSFYRMMVEAGVRESSNYNDKFIKKLPNLFYINSEKFISFILKYLEGKETAFDIENQLMQSMLFYTFYDSNPKKEGFNSIEEGLNNIFTNDDFKKEVIDILEYNYEHMELLSLDNTLNKDNPLQVHCSYNTKQIMAAFEYYNEEKTPAFREGVKYFDDKKLDIFFITLNKSEKDYSPSTLYKDYAINESLFHWESQSTTSQESSTGKRYINHRKTGNEIALFVREYKKYNGYTSPYIFLGECEYISHKGDKPISFVWKLKEEIPPNLVVAANKSIL